MIGTLLQDLRYGVRMLARNPGFTVVAVLTLALGIGANTAVFTLVNGILIQPVPFPEPDRLFLVSFIPRHAPFENSPSLSDADYLAFRAGDHLFDGLATFGTTGANLTGAGDAVRISAATVTTGFFPVLRVAPAIGRSFLPDEDEPGRDQVALLSDQLWRQRFGADPHILGKSIKLDGVDRTVIGIMPAGFNFPSHAEVWTPLLVLPPTHNSFSRPVVGRLKPGVSRQQAQVELETLARHFSGRPGEQHSDWLAQVLPLKDLLIGKVRRSLLIFAGAVGLVLLIACANFANLLLARAAGREREMAVRAALGAGRWRLVRQLLAEGLLVSLAGGAAGIVLALWAVPALLALAPAGKVPRLEMIRIDGWVLGFALGLSLLTGIVASLAPALRGASRDVRDALSQGGRTETGRHEAVRGALVVSEIALALTLLTGAGLMLKSFLRLSAVAPGFRPENVMTLAVDLPNSVYRTPEQLKDFHDRMLTKLDKLPGVTAAGAVNWLPLTDLLVKGDFQMELGRTRPEGFIVDKMCVSPGYFRALGIPLLAGRDFSNRDDSRAPGVVIVSQSVARRLWPGEDPLGKRISMEDHPKPGDWLTVVGVVEDVKQEGLARQANPATYQPYAQITLPFFLSHMTFVVRTAPNAVGIAAGLRAALREVDRDQPVQSIATMQELVFATTAEPRFQTRLLLVFAGLALALAVVGIYGILAYTVAQRTHEFGIRVALGAEAQDVLRLVLRRTLLLLGAGVALGVAGALAATRVLATLLFDVRPTDPATFAAVAVLVSFAALAAGLIPARRATKVDPMIALRYE